LIHSSGWKYIIFEKKEKKQNKTLPNNLYITMGQNPVGIINLQPQEKNTPDFIFF